MKTKTKTKRGALPQVQFQHHDKYKDKVDDNNLNKDEDKDKSKTKRGALPQVQFQHVKCSYSEELYVSQTNIRF